MEHNSANHHSLPPDQEKRLSLQPDLFCQTLTNDEVALISIRDELYESSWERMETDLRNRLTGKPYIFKLVNRIELDLALLAFLRTYEETNSLDLGQLLQGEGS